MSKPLRSDLRANPVCWLVLAGLGLVVLSGQQCTPTNGGPSGEVSVQLLAPLTFRDLAQGDSISIVYTTVNASTVEASYAALQPDGSYGMAVPFGTPTTGSNRTVMFDTTGVAIGNYRVTIRASNSGSSASADTPSTIRVNGPPVPQIISPATDTVVGEDGEVSVIFDPGDPENNVSWTLFYDVDNEQNGDEVEIATGVGNNQLHVWNTLGVPAGTYYLGVQATDNLGSVAAIYSTATVEIPPEVHAPNISILSPSEDVTAFGGSSVVIELSASSTTGNAVINVFFDQDGDFDGDEQPIASSLPEETTQVVFDTVGVPDGTYFIGASATDGVSTTTTYASGRVMVVAVGDATVTEPAENITVPPGTDVTIQWTTNVPSGSGWVDVFYQSDTNGDGIGDGPEADVPGATGLPTSTTSAVLNTTGLNGRFVVGIRITTTVGTIRRQANGTVRVSVLPSIFWLGNIGSGMEGAIFQGANTEDNAGSSAIGVGDYTGDNRAEFTVGAQYGKPGTSSGGVGAGEAYLIFGDSQRFNGTFNLSSTGTSILPGITFEGIDPDPATFDTDGLAGISAIDDIDGDGISEIAFSFPRVDSIGHSVQRMRAARQLEDLDGNDLESADQFLNGGVVFVSSRNPTLRTVSASGATIPLELVGQDFELPSIYDEAEMGDVLEALLLGANCDHDPEDVARFSVVHSLPDPYQVIVIAYFYVFSLDPEEQGVGEVVTATLYMDAPEEDDFILPRAYYCNDDCGQGSLFQSIYLVVRDRNTLEVLIQDLQIPLDDLGDQPAIVCSDTIELSITSDVNPPTEGSISAGFSFCINDPMVCVDIPLYDCVRDETDGTEESISTPVEGFDLRLSPRYDEMRPGETKTPAEKKFDELDIDEDFPCRSANPEIYDPCRDFVGNFIGTGFYPLQAVDPEAEDPENPSEDEMIDNDAREPEGARIIGEQVGDLFGTGVAVVGNHMIVTAPGNIPDADDLGIAEHPDAGMGYMFLKKETDRTGRNRFWWNDTQDDMPLPFHYVINNRSYCGRTEFNTDTPSLFVGDEDDQLRNVIGLPDFNGDGIDDVAFGAPLAARGDGMVYVWFRRSSNPSRNINLLSENPARGIAILGTIGAEEGLGAAMTVAPDFNGDGVSDLVLGNPGANNGLGDEQGEIIVVFASDSLANQPGGWSIDELVDSGQAARLAGDQAGSLFGFNVANVGDVDGDGTDDLLVAAPGGTPRFDSDGDDTLDTKGLDLNLDGLKDDVDNNGQLDDRDDLEQAGLVYLILGSSTIGGSMNISQLGSSTLRGAIYVGRSAGDQLGGGNIEKDLEIDGVPKSGRPTALGPAGDVDGDGKADFLLGAPLADPSGRTNGGEAYLLYGRVP